MDIANMTIPELVDLVIELDIEKSKDAKQIDAIKAELEARGNQKMDDKHVKTVQFYGSNGSTYIGEASKIDVIDRKMLENVFGEERIHQYVKSENVVKYTATAPFKEIAEAIFFDEYDSEKTVDDILKELGVPEDKIKLSTKKIKGDYKKDKKVLKSWRVPENDELEIALFMIYRAMMYKKIVKHLGTEKLDEKIENIKKAIIVEQTTKVTVEYDKKSA